MGPDVVNIDLDWLDQQARGGFVDAKLVEAMKLVLWNVRDFQSAVVKLREEYQIDQFWGVKGEENWKDWYVFFNSERATTNLNYPDGFVERTKEVFLGLLEKEVVIEAIYGRLSDWFEFFTVFSFTGVLFHRGLPHFISSHQEGVVEANMKERVVVCRYLTQDDAVFLEVPPETTAAHIQKLLKALKEKKAVDQKKIQHKPALPQYRQLAEEFSKGHEPTNESVMRALRVTDPSTFKKYKKESQRLGFLV